jgi:hypothetical protein
MVNLLSTFRRSPLARKEGVEMKRIVGFVLTVATAVATAIAVSAGYPWPK